MTILIWNTTNNQLEPPERFLRKHTGGGGGGQTRAKSARTYSGFSSFDHPYLHHLGVENLHCWDIIVFSSFILMHEPSFASKNAVIYEKKHLTIKIIKHKLSLTPAGKNMLLLLVTQLP